MQKTDRPSEEVSDGPARGINHLGSQKLVLLDFLAAVSVFADQTCHSGDEHRREEPSG
jgi:hypothetical protein